MTRGFWTGPALATVAGLVLLLATAGGWVSGEEAREVGGVVVTEPTSTSGTQFAPSAVVVGLVALLGGVLLGVLRGTPRRGLAVVVALLGLGGLGLVGVGLSRAFADDGVLTPAPWFAGVAAAGIVVAGWAAWRGPAAPPARSRYRVEGEQSGDDEWDLASGPE